MVVIGHEPGGQLSLTTLVENFPGFPEGIMGPQLIENMRKQAERFGAEYRLAHLTSVDLSQRPFLLHLGKQLRNLLKMTNLLSVLGDAEEHGINVG